MDKNEFLAIFAEQFEDTDPKLIKFETKFHELDEWSSLVSMMLIAMAKMSFIKKITGSEIRNCITVEDVYDLIKNK